MTLESISPYLQMPLDVYFSAYSSTLEKTVSAVAIAVLSTLTLGWYAYKTYQFSQLTAIKFEFMQCFLNNNVAGAEKLLIQEPLLKGELNRKEAFLINNLIAYAISRQQTAMADLLLKHGAKIDGPEGTESALREVLLKDLEMTKWLLERKADPNLNGYFSGDPIGYISYCSSPDSKPNPNPQHLETIELLVKHGANVNTNRGCSPLYSLGRFWNNNSHFWNSHSNNKIKQIMEEMLKKGALLNADDTNGAFRSNKPLAKPLMDLIRRYNGPVLLTLK